MGIVITKDVLKKIYNDYEANKHKLPQKKIIVETPKNIDIFQSILINKNNNKLKNEINIKNNIKIEKSQQPKQKNDKKDIEINKKINNILFRKCKSPSSILNKKMKKELILPRNIYINNDNNSEDDNISENSDYLDISNESFFLNRANKKKENNIKSIKLRNSYYTKLVLSNILSFKKESKVTNIFIFDWDDTLMCTSYVAPTGVLNFDDMKQNDKNTMKNLDQLVSNLLSKSLEKGLVFIITNAAYGWVEFSAKKLYPSSYELLKKIKIVSARSMCEKKYPGDYRQWKTKAFIDTIQKSNINFLKTANIISFGDSIIELEASHKLKEIFADGYIKTIKFKENPQPLELIKELKIILQQFDVILSNVRNLSIKVAKKKNE